MKYIKEFVIDGVPVKIRRYNKQKWKNMLIIWSTTLKEKIEFESQQAESMLSKRKMHKG